MSTGEIAHFSWKLIGMILRQITVELDWYKLKPWIKFSSFLSWYRLCSRRMIWRSRTLVPIWRTRLFQYKDPYKRTCWWCFASDHVSQKHPYRCYLNRCKFSCHHWSLVPTCHKNRNNRGFLRFPDTKILTTIAILRTARQSGTNNTQNVADLGDNWRKVRIVIIRDSYDFPTLGFLRLLRFLGQAGSHSS